jgi:hypothetical protein
VKVHLIALLFFLIFDTRRFLKKLLLLGLQVGRDSFVHLLLGGNLSFEVLDSIYELSFRFKELTVGAGLLALDLAFEKLSLQTVLDLGDVECLFLLSDLLFELIGVLGVVVDGRLLILSHLLNFLVAFTFLLSELLEFIHIREFFTDFVSELLIGQIAEVVLEITNPVD